MTMTTFTMTSKTAPQTSEQDILMVPMDLEFSLGKIQEEDNENMDPRRNGNKKAYCEPITLTRTMSHTPFTTSIPSSPSKTQRSDAAIVSPCTPAFDETTRVQLLRDRIDNALDLLPPSMTEGWYNEDDVFSVSSEESETVDPSEMDLTMEDPVSFWDASAVAPTNPGEGTLQM